jgi:3-deoxy-D-manno-octulosonic-acid transferase
MRLLYTILVYLAAPIALAVNWLRARRDPSYGERLRERWGFAQARFERPSLWVHAVSVGEVQAGAVLIRALKERFPEHSLVVTTGTPTGAQRVQALFGGSVQHVYLPYDMPGAVRRFLDRVRPAAGIVMETEIWPNLFRECRHRGVPLLIASARLSEKSVRRYGRLRGLASDALAGVRIAAQSNLDAKRFKEIGATLVEVVGNLKFDIDVREEVAKAGQSLRADQFAARPVWIAASTHEGEEERALTAHEIVRARLEDALLILVPRHPQRFPDVAALLAERRVPYVSRSRGERVTEATRVLLVDTLGELLMLYAAVDVAFVAGSLVPIGGHTLLEPAALGCPIIVGPHNFNAPDIAQMLLSSSAAIQVADEKALGGALVRLLNDADERRDMAARAREILEKNRGALARLIDIIESVVPRSTG